MIMRRLFLSLLVCACASVVVASEPTRKPWIGMGLVLRQSPDGSKFLYVAAVPSGTPAAKAGVAASDVITAINGKAITFRDDLDLMEFMASLRPGDDVRFQLTRSGTRKTVVVKTGQLPLEYEERARESMERAREARKSRDARTQ